jgi:hypothetical protein
MVVTFISPYYRDPVKPKIETVACLKYLGKLNLRKYKGKSADNCKYLGSFSLKAWLTTTALTPPALTN